jgi:glutamate synthase (ferredoxin)
MGQSQKLNVNKAIKHYKASGLDLSTILYKPEKSKNGTESQYNNTRSRIRERLDFQIIKAIPSIYRKEKTRVNFKIKIQTVL